jgi:hypothetical protein
MGIATVPVAAIGVPRWRDARIDAACFPRRGARRSARAAGANIASRYWITEMKRSTHSGIDRTIEPA